MASGAVSLAVEPSRYGIGAGRGGPLPPSEDSNAATEISGAGTSGGGLFRGMYFTVVAISRDDELSKRASQAFRSVQGEACVWGGGQIT